MSGLGIAYDPEANERTTVAWQGDGTTPSALDRVQKRGKTPEPSNSNIASNGMRVTIRPDGSVDIDMPSPAIKRTQSDKFDANLAEELPDSVLSAVAHDYLDGVQNDIIGRSQFIANYNRGIDLLGLTIEQASAVRGSRTGITKAKHPALLKACVRSQSNARGQLLPATGPVKVSIVGDSNEGLDDRARHFENRLNYFFTDIATEFYPDTDRSLFYRAFGGSIYKQVYRCPLRRRPVSEFVSLDNFIVAEDSTDIANAVRKTKESIMAPANMRRMQILGGWRDVPLSQPQVNDNPARRKILETQGLMPMGNRAKEMDYTVYDGCWTFDPGDYGYTEKKAPEGLPIPYRIVMDRDSRQVLGLWRNWREQDEMFRERQMYVKYGLVPGLGFLDYGFLHLIGNQTRVLTAGWQILTDKGMLSNFPGGMKVKGVRTATNEINPGLGEWVEVDIGGLDDIRKALMGMPYGTITPEFIQLLQSIEEDVERLAGTIEIESGSSRSNMPVGTILAMIEQQAQDLTAVHQRDHRSQKEEIGLIRQLFIDNPQDLKWLEIEGGDDQDELLREFRDLKLSPASDPNVPSQMHRIMINQFLLQLAQGAPMIFGSKLRKVAMRVMTSIGIGDADSLLASQQEIMQAIQQQSQARTGRGGGGNPAAGQATIAKAQMELPLKQQELALEARKVELEEQENQRQAANEAAETQEREADRQAKMAIDQMTLEHKREELATDHVKNFADAALEHSHHQDELAHEAGQQQLDREHEADLEETRAQAAKETAKAAAKAEPRLQRPKRERKSSAKAGGRK